MNEIYFDNASTTVLRQEVLEEMIPYFNRFYGNSSGSNQYSKKASDSLEESREIIANLIGAKPSEIFFTSGGTESNNLAILGYCYGKIKKLNCICCSKVEHSSVLNPFKKLEEEGFQLLKLENNKEGKVVISNLAELNCQNIDFISVMLANNELGTIQPVKELKAFLGKKTIFHADAVQAGGKIRINVRELGLDMLSLSAHKFYGPKGVGLLYIKEGTKITPLLYGGGHENKIRPGTINIAGIVGMKKALELSINELEESNERIYDLENIIIQHFTKIEGVKLNSPVNFKNKVPGILHYTIDGIHDKTLLGSYNMNGISLSSGSACSSIDNKTSHVIQAIGGKDKGNVSQLRISLGKYNTEQEVELFLQISTKVISKLRSKNKRLV